MNTVTELGQALVALEEQTVNSLVEQELQAGKAPLEIVKECNMGMVEIGRRFENNEYFISELIMAGEIFKDVMSRLEPFLTDGARETSKGTIVIGTVKGDLHDIGKNIVITLLKGTGYEIVDLGVDVATEKFVNAVRDTGAKVLGMSALLNTTYPYMKEVVEALETAGVRNGVTVIIGGAPCNEQVRQSVGADHYATDATKGLRICQDVYGG